MAAMSALPASTALLDDEHEHIAALLGNVSIETSSRNPNEIDRYVDLVPAGTDVYVAHIPGETHHRLVAVATRLRERGFNPVPHVAVRNFASFTQLRDYLARLTGEAGVRQALVIAGDVAKPAGPYDAAIQVLETGLFDKLGIRRIGFSGYPEGSSRIGDGALASALASKTAYARRTGLDAYIVTQFSFEAEPIAAWIAHTRAAGINLPIRVGLAGPATLRTLLKFALRCNIGNSIRALGAHASAITQILSENGPDRVVRALAHSHTAGEITGLHFFPFGGFARSAAWIAAVRRGDFDLHPDDDGFTLRRS
jgi:methylenetetrahydrofolate reductase (NADPH)